MSATAWIPTDTRVPDPLVDVQVLCAPFAAGEPYEVHVAHLKTGLGWHTPYDEQPLEARVLAWQPLAEPWAHPPEEVTQ